MKKPKIIIIGAGLVGLAQALALAQKDIQVVLIEEQKFVFSKEKMTARVSAINLSSIEFLRSLDIKTDQVPLTRLEKLVVWDDLTQAEIDFDAAMLGKAELGAIIENRELLRSLWLAVEQNKNIEIIYAEPQNLVLKAGQVELTLSNQQTLIAELIIGADGAQSWLRNTLNIEIKERSYHQKAIIACVENEKVHQNTGWQNFLNTGPLALLPLNNPHNCAIVWSSDDARALELMAMDESQFNIEINNAFGSRLGEIKLLSERQLFPLIMRHAKNYVLPHAVLIGDAAHSLHPLAGQGVNLGFMDAQSLAKHIDAKNPANFKNLRRYERERKAANTRMLFAMRGLRDLFASQNAVLVPARAWGLQALNKADFIKNALMECL